MEETQNEERSETQYSNQAQSNNNGTTLLRTCFNGVNAMSGVGILSVPYALSEGGWLALILLSVIAVVSCYTSLLLRRCMDTNSLVKTYPDVGELAFGYRGKLLVASFMYFALYILAIEFLILEGDNLNKLFPDVISFKMVGLKIGGKKVFILLALLIILPTTWLRNLGLLAYVSASGVLASVILVVCVFWVGAVDDVGFHAKGKVLDWGRMPTVVSVFAFCYSAHSVLPTLYTSMKDKSQFPKVLVICFALCTFNYGSIAILGYLMYGEGLKSQVTLNLPVEKLSSRIAIYTTLINPLTKYAIIITPVARAIEDRFSSNKSMYISLIIRTGLVISTLVLALIAPPFGYLVAFSGAFLSATMSFLLPCICYLKITKTYKIFGVELVTIIGILVIGFMVTVLGTYTSVKRIISDP